MGAQIKAELVAARADKLFFYSPYNFLRKLDVEKQQQLFGTGQAERYGTDSTHRLFEFRSGTATVQCLYAFLPWDTEFFKAPIYKLFTVLFADATPVATLIAALAAFRNQLREEGAAYCFTELPIEDIRITQALGAAGWHLVETRLNFYQDRVAEFEWPRHPVQSARPEQAERIGNISAAARNEYDRFHADPWFAEGQADQFLARYAAASVEGYCDDVLIPNQPELPIDSFLAISDLKEHGVDLNASFSRVVLTAVGPANKGWHLKLVAETLHRARLQGADYVLMTTQATNRAVFRTCDKLGFKLGSTTCVFAFSF